MIKRILLSTIVFHSATYTMETPEQPLFSIERHEDEERGTVEYVHDFADKQKRIDIRLNRINHFQYYGAVYNSKTKTYRSFDDGATIGSHIVRRPSHASEGHEGSHAAQCYESLKMRYEKQQAEKAQIAQTEAPAATGSLKISGLWAMLGFSFDQDKK